MAQEFQMFRKIKGLNSVTARQACEIPDCEKSIWGMTMLSPGQKLGLLAKRSVTSLFFLFFERERWLDIQDGIRCLGMCRRAWRTVSCNPVLKASINQWEFEKGYLWRTQLCLQVRCRLHQAPISTAISRAGTVGPFSGWGDWGRRPWRRCSLPSISPSAFLPELLCLNKHFGSWKLECAASGFQEIDFSSSAGTGNQTAGCWREGGWRGNEGITLRTFTETSQGPGKVLQTSHSLLSSGQHYGMGVNNNRHNS